ncbi:MAG: hypothetical protein ICV59_00800 [Thermoleophilia bacterium]|nr:hypothetical protein [Thermoleophilia bacterium]
MSSTMPPDQPIQPSTTTTTTGSRPGLSASSLPSILNAEFLVFLLVWLVLAILWAATDEVTAGLFATLSTALTFAYLISRGIAKASRVYEDTPITLR